MYTNISFESFESSASYRSSFSLAKLLRIHIMLGLWQQKRPAGLRKTAEIVGPNDVALSATMEKPSMPERFLFVRKASGIVQALTCMSPKTGRSMRLSQAKCFSSRSASKSSTVVARWQRLWMSKLLLKPSPTLSILKRPQGRFFVVVPRSLTYKWLCLELRSAHLSMRVERR